MNRHGQTTFDWADGAHTFRLGLGEIEELERKFDRSIFLIADDLKLRRARASEIREVLRVGLIGGGMAPGDALALTRRYVDEMPLYDSLEAAFAVAWAGITRVHGSEEQPPGEAAAAEPGASTSPPSSERPS